MFRKIQVSIIILLIPLGGLFLLTQHNDFSLRDLFNPTTPTIHLGDQPVKVEVADTAELREIGLSGRNELASAQGLLFVYDEPGYHGIWMKDMKFAIDLIWISEDLEIVGITEGVRPESYPKIYEPPQPALYLIETNTRFADTFGIRVGDKVRLPRKFAD